MNKFLRLSAALATVALIATVGLTSCKKDFDQPPVQTDPAIVANTSIKDLKAKHTIANGSYDLISTDIIISGIVVADDKSGNFYKQLFIEDSTGGLQIMLDATNLYGTFPVGRKVFVKCNGLTISDYNGTMQLGVKATVSGNPSLEGIPASLISNYVIGGTLNNPVVPHVVTLAQLTTGLQDRYLGTLIQLDGYAFNTLNTTYSDTSVYKSTKNLDIKNCSGQTTIIRTSAYANFAGVTVPSGRGSVAAIYTTFGTTKQLLLRDTSDVKFRDPYACPLAPGTLLSENFEAIGANNLTLTLPSGWKNIAETGTVLYQNAVFGTVKCAKISAFSTGQATVKTWLITPQINLTGATAPNLTFTTSAGFLVGATGFSVMVSTNYTGSATPQTATWTTLPATIATAPASGYSAFVSSGTINLSAYIGQNVYIAFKYDGGDPTKTTTYEVDDVVVKAF